MSSAPSKSVRFRLPSEDAFAGRMEDLMRKFAHLLWFATEMEISDAHIQKVERMYPDEVKRLRGPHREFWRGYYFGILNHARLSWGYCGRLRAGETRQQAIRDAEEKFHMPPPPKCQFRKEKDLTAAP